MLFLFILLFFYHNNTGDYMKFLFSLLLFFCFCFDIYASDLNFYISKRDIDTLEFIDDSYFTLYDSNNNFIDGWYSNDNHGLSLVSGNYKLAITPVLNGKLADYSNYYDVSVNDNVTELIFYNDKIATPKNLFYNNFFSYVGCVFIFIGLFLILSRKFYYN